MADISKLELNGNIYNLKDATSRELIESATEGVRENASAISQANKRISGVEDVASSNTENISSLEDKTDSTNDELKSVKYNVDLINAKVGNNSTEIGSLGWSIKSQGETIETIEDNISNIDNLSAELSEKVSVIEARVSEITNLPEGSTTGDAELNDIRIGGNGVTYPSAGDAVRAQFNINRTSWLRNNTSQSKEINNSILWELGAINANTGGLVASSERIRTKDYLNQNICYLDLNDNTKGFFIYGYDANNQYVGQWVENDRQFVIDGGGIYTACDLQNIYDKYPNYHVKICVLRRGSYAYPKMADSSGWLAYNGFANFFEPKTVKVLQYNIGKFNYGHSGGLDTGVTVKINNYKKFLGSEKFDFCCMQEYTEYINALQTVTSNSLFDYMFAHSSHYEREKIIKSNYILLNSRFSYLHQSGDVPSDVIYCDTRINNKPVRIVTGVLNVEATIAQKLYAINKFITLMNDAKNVIACFDTNALSAEEANSIKSAFASGGFKSANWSFFGDFDTYNLASSVYHPIDNIFAKGDIVISNVYVPDVYSDLSSDHFPFITELTIY